MFVLCCFAYFSIEAIKWKLFCMGVFAELHLKVIVHFVQICTPELIQNTAAIGGPGHIVSIDETFVAKRKPGNPQGQPVKQLWVFGGVDYETK